jgi:hypothetical protein
VRRGRHLDLDILIEIARLDMLGPDRGPMGTDLPFAIAEGEPVRLIDAAGFSPCERAGGNPLRSGQEVALVK